MRESFTVPSEGQDLFRNYKPPSIHPVLLRFGSKTIDIPAGEPDYVVTDSYTLPVAVKALSIYPHAHYLAREMIVVAEMPDGGTERLLRISDWDFNWQDQYEYVEPVPLPKGARLVMRYVYDKSAANPHNPSSPPRRVVTGPGGDDELGELLIQLLAANEADAALLRAETSRKALLMDVAGEEKRIADVPGDHAVRNSLGVHYVQLGRNDEAREQFLAALELSPDHAVAHYNLGLIGILGNRPEEAFTHLNQAIAVLPSYAEAHSNLGVLLEATGRADEAFVHYRTALESRPDNVAAHANLARILMHRRAARSGHRPPRAPAAASAGQPGGPRQSGRGLCGGRPDGKGRENSQGRHAARACGKKRRAGASARRPAAGNRGPGRRRGPAACRRMISCG
jgi:tetratricopeptide (TPR) repeat protein